MSTMSYLHLCLTLRQSILWRQKEQFSDGVGYGWIDSLKDYAEKEVTDEEWDSRETTFPYNTPQTREAYFYRKSKPITTSIDSWYRIESDAVLLNSLCTSIPSRIGSIDGCDLGSNLEQEHGPFRKSSAGPHCCHRTHLSSRRLKCLL